MIDMRKYGGGDYITVDDVRDGPLQNMKIADVKDGRFDKPDLYFETDQILSLNATNRKTLVRTYGPNSDAWIGKLVDLKLGETAYQGKQQELVIVQPISPPLTAAEKTASAAAVAGVGSDMDDDIPFLFSAGQRIGSFGLPGP